MDLTEQPTSPYGGVREYCQELIADLNTQLAELTAKVEQGIAGTTSNTERKCWLKILQVLLEVQ